MTADSNQFMIQPLLAQWQTLHDSYENYEKYALIIKLVAILLSLTAYIFSVSSFVILLLLVTLWLQEGIWKTFQQRTENSITEIEKKLALVAATNIADSKIKPDINQASNDQVNELNINSAPYLLYTQWQANRSGVVGLITEYINNSLKPTVIYPYLPLIVMVLIF
ncbi:hypothetical protein [Colwellia sp. E2M01]|uniref:hypothetical protein n=1 Tax=Colwellia sp. E2M01 TaxID=2841561 RepID=UPI001C09786A|nr:hypothetical protein [Colwellia sp. E2M01]MBU2869915.1 hypothetical protein [Colwellia sp. E2M01]